MVALLPSADAAVLNALLRDLDRHPDKYPTQVFAGSLPERAINDAPDVIAEDTMRDSLRKGGRLVDATSDGW